jgi:hypothetical protein
MPATDVSLQPVSWCRCSPAGETSALSAGNIHRFRKDSPQSRMHVFTLLCSPLAMDFVAAVLFNGNQMPKNSALWKYLSTAESNTH